MKDRMFWKWSLGLSLAILPLVGGCLPENASPPVTNSIIQNEVLSPPVGSTKLAAPVVSETPPPGVTNLETAPVTLVSTEKPVPASIKITAPVSEIVKLANSGVDESVMLAFVTNSASTFNLGADEIIYLKDIGVPGSVVTAMIDRDQQIRGASLQAAVAAQQAAPPVPAPEQPAPAPADVAPQVDPNAAPAPAPPQPAVTSSGFYDTLSPYGSWVNVEGYGLCWQPTVVVVNPTWRPYYDSGHWVYTDCGWYWMSDYSWGWAPFHYGRWFQHYRIGWCWAPDYVWGPSWVSWRYNNAYCGWAPLPPAACYQPGFGFTYYGHHVGASFGFGIGIGCWNFVSVAHFNDRHFHHYAVPHQDVHRVYGATVAVNKITVNRHNTVVNTGIPPERVASASRTPIHKVSIREVPTAAPRTGRGDQLDPAGGTLTVYKPRITQPSRTSTTVRPTREITKTSPAGTPSAATSQTVVPSAAYRLQNRQMTQMRASDTPTVASSKTPISPAATATPQRPNRAEPLIIHGNNRSTAPHSTFTPTPTRNLSTATTPAPAAPASTLPPGLRPRTSATAATAPTPATPAAPAWSSSRAMQTPSRQQAAPTLGPPKANPGLNTRNSSTAPAATPTPTPIPRTYSAPAYQPQGRNLAEVSRYPAPTYSAPSYSAPQRSYSAPAAQPAQKFEAPRSAPAPAPAQAAPSASKNAGGDNRGGGGGNGRQQR
jgi:hypothetical protein